MKRGGKIVYRLFRFRVILTAATTESNPASASSPIGVSIGMGAGILVISYPTMVSFVA
jgi:hypothetical protein